MCRAALGLKKFARADGDLPRPSASSPADRDVRSDLQASSCCTGTWPFAVSTFGSIDRPTILHICMQSDIGKALFLTLKKALEQGMIGDDKDYSGKVCLKWKDTEFER